MDFMASFAFFLEQLKKPLNQKRKERVSRQGLICFLESLALYLKAGFALSYSWEQSISSAQGGILSEVVKTLMPKVGEDSANESLGKALKRLNLEGDSAMCRVWFGVLAELYESGADLTPAVEAFSGVLRRELQRDLEAHCRTLPMKANIILLLFFFPPTIICLFVPLLVEILAQFN
jgi:hypothetical protein